MVPFIAAAPGPYTPCMRRTLIASLLFTAVSFASNVSGTWKAVGPGTSTATIILKQSGDSLTGLYLGLLGRGEITGAISGDSIKWTFNNGEGPVRYEGTIKNDKKIEGEIGYYVHAKIKFVAEKISNNTDEKKLPKKTD
jgi:hypothetical protein